MPISSANLALALRLIAETQSRLPEVRALGVRDPFAYSAAKYLPALRALADE